MIRAPRRKKSAKARNGREGGFTIVEVLVVTVIISILVAIVVVSLVNALERAKQRATMADMRTICKALEAYQADVGHYPTNGLTIQQLAATLIPYQSSVVPTEDHWRHPYVYTVAANNYSIESYGKDGVDGAEIDYANRFSFDLDIILSNGVFTASPEQ
jgi:general secretion pathway protein G